MSPGHEGIRQRNTNRCGGFHAAGSDCSSRTILRHHPWDKGGDEQLAKIRRSIASHDPTATYRFGSSGSGGGRIAVGSSKENPVQRFREH
jgi:hypothetical protein